MTRTDMLGRPLAVGDYVVSYNHIYQVIDTPARYQHHARIRLVGGRNSRPKIVETRAMCVIPSGDVMIWLLKRDSNT